MHKLHKRLSTKFVWYQAWHQHPRAAVYHWAILITIMIVSSLAVRTAIIKRFLTDTAVVPALAQLSSSTRDPALWPFTDTAPRNHPIGTNAQYADITSPGLQLTGSNLANINCSNGYNKPIFLAQPTDPIRNIYRTGSLNPVFTIRVPNNAAPATGTDATLYLIDENHRFMVEMWKAVKRADGDWDAGSAYQLDLRQDTGIGPGATTYLVGVSASGMSSLSGVIRQGELTNGIRHALGVSVRSGAMNKNGPNGHPYVWPAISADGHWQTSYGSTGNVYMGSLLAIPQNVDITQIGVGTSGPAYEIAKALQAYGVYVHDSGPANMAFSTDGADCNELAGLETVGDWSSLVIPHLKVVTNNGSNSLGGGGQPIAPLAPPFDPQYTTVTSPATPTPSPNQPPIISAVSATPTSGTAPLTVQFSTTASDPDGTIASYDWDFGDGTVASGANTSHVYNTAGNYSATVKVTDDQAATTTSSPVSITVTAIPTVTTVPVITISVIDGVAAEPGTNTGGLTITRSTSQGGELTVFYSIGGTATNGKDYQTLSGSIKIPTGANSALLTIVPLDDTLLENKEIVQVTITPNASYQLSRAIREKVTIYDNERRR